MRVLPSLTSHSPLQIPSLTVHISTKMIFYGIPLLLGCLMKNPVSAQDEACEIQIQTVSPDGISFNTCTASNSVCENAPNHDLGPSCQVVNVPDILLILCSTAKSGSALVSYYMSIGFTCPVDVSVGGVVWKADCKYVGHVIHLYASRSSLI